jgi:hypothetical protein
MTVVCADQRATAVNTKRSVEHYREHELVSEAAPAAHGWYFTICIVTHHGDDSDSRSERSPPQYASDLEALRAARERGHSLIDELILSDTGELHG